MIEELAAHILGVDVDEKWDDLDELLIDKFNIDLHLFEQLIEKLLPLCHVAKGALSDDVYCGFADKPNGVWILKVLQENSDAR